MKKKKTGEDEKNIRAAVRALQGTAGVGEEKARSVGEAPFGAGMSWGDALVQFEEGDYYASAFVFPEKELSEALPSLGEVGFDFEFIEAPSAKRFEALKKKMQARRDAARRLLEAVLKRGARAEEEKAAQENADSAEKKLLKVELAEKAAQEPGCIARFVVTTSRGSTQEEAMEKLRGQVRRILSRTGGYMLKEDEVKKCLGWEDAAEESIGRVRAKTRWWSHVPEGIQEGAKKFVGVQK